jgi:hypothetical protein
MTRRTPSKPRDVVTLADLAPRHRVVGGSERRVFGADAPARRQEDTMAGTKKAAKDLSAKASTVKGGGHNLNDNLTLVRAAKPAKKDLPLPSGKDVKAGKKAL